MRAGALLMGVAAACVFRMPDVLDGFGRWRVVPLLGGVTALGVAAICMHWPLVMLAPRGVEVAFLALYRTVFGAAVAYLIVASVSEQPWGAALGRLLSSRLLYPIGQLAYCAYLLNPIVTTLVDARLAPLVWESKVPPFPLFLPFDLLGTFLAAAAVYLFVERPFTELRPRSERARSA
jgi:peptidoglycan/LPS O-acetylase OafA/YrhL